MGFVALATRNRDSLQDRTCADLTELDGRGSPDRLTGDRLFKIAVAARSAIRSLP